MSGKPPIMLSDGLRAFYIDEDGVTESYEAAAALDKLAERPHLLIHSVFTIDRLMRASNLEQKQAWAKFNRAIEQHHFDILELFAFVKPGEFILPNLEGVLSALKFSTSDQIEEKALRLYDAVQILLNICMPHQVNKLGLKSPRQARQLAKSMHIAGWVWGAQILKHMGVDVDNRPELLNENSGVAIWQQLPNWEEFAPKPPPNTLEISPDESLQYLAKFIGDKSELREGQRDYVRQASNAYKAIGEDGMGHVVLAEAGTGIGKTYGYLAPSIAWAKKNSGKVQISTYTKALQRQIDQQLHSIYPDLEDKKKKSVIRKGRENYLCLLNFEEWAGKAIHQRGAQAIVAGLLARWGLNSLDGDMVGGDLPSWLLPLLTHRNAEAASRLSINLTDRRGECIHGACNHYSKCFIEKSKRRAQKAELVISNHALVMHNLALDGFMKVHNHKKPSVIKNDEEKDQEVRPRIVFDEGHHLFDAADSCFASHLTGLEMAELRRWLRGAEKSSGRARGLKARLEELIYDDESAMSALTEVMHHAMSLPAQRWHSRLNEENPEGPAEQFLAAVKAQIYARNPKHSPYDLEIDCYPLMDGIIEAADGLKDVLHNILQPLSALSKRLSSKLIDEAETLEIAQKNKIESAIAGIDSRAFLLIPNWIQMLDGLKNNQQLVQDNQPLSNEVVDWFHLKRQFGKDFDVGMYRHLTDPSRALAKYVLSQLDSALITSATLRDQLPDTLKEVGAAAPKELDWQAAESRTGASHMAKPALRFSCKSPFDYGSNSDVIIIQDVNKNDMLAVSRAMESLFVASGGAGLGLFTAISRLRLVYQNLLHPLSGHNLNLFAQHVDPLDIGTLIDLFRADQTSCLLGTDAVRDGVDVPGDSLKLLVYERVPWMQPNILGRARMKQFGGNQYSDMMTRFKLKQAFGRLIRSSSDRGVFVMLDKQMPSRMLSAFPEDVAIHKLGLKDAISLINDKLK